MKLQNLEQLPEVRETSTFEKACQRCFEIVGEVLIAGNDGYPVAVLLQGDLAHTDDIRRQHEAALLWAVVGREYEKMEREMTLRLNQVVHPAGHTSSDEGIGSLNDETDISF